MSADLVGSPLGKYEVRAEIGRGGMGTVYLGYDPLLDRQVAIKVLAPHLVWEPGFVERFLREARAAARLRHPNVVTIYDVGQEGSHYYFVMELLEGQTLAQVIKQRGPLSTADITAILRPLAGAIDQAHGQGLIHRDIKPGNIMVGPAGQVVLTDFGIARAAQAVGLTTTGTLVGTPEYMSPEQARGEVVDARTDQYSLGVVAYEMLSGKVPFGGTTPHGVLYRQIHEPPPPISEIRPDLPPAVQSVLQKALAKDPGQRYATATAFVEALGQALGQAPGPAVADEAAETAAADMPTLLAEQPREAVAAPASTPPSQQPTRAAPPPRPAATPGGAPARARAPSRRRSGRVWLLAGLALVVAAGVLVGVILLLGGGGGVEGRATATPLPAAEAQALPTSSRVPTLSPEPEQPEEPLPPAQPFECPDPAGCVDLPPGEPLRLGSLLATEGENAAIGLDSQRGVELALDDWQEILGHPLGLVTEATSCEPDSAVAAAEVLAGDPELVAVVGPSCSSEAWAAVPMLCEHGFAVVSPSASAPALTAEGGLGESWCFLRTVANDAALSLSAARFAREVLEVDRAATVQDDSPYAGEMQAVFAEAFSELGGTIVAQEWVAPDSEGYEPLLEHIAESGAQLIYLQVNLEPGSEITVGARQMPGLEGVQLLGAHQLFTPELFARVGEAAHGFWWAQPDDAFGDRAGELADRYAERYGEWPSTTFYASAYDATTMVLAAVEAAGVEDDSGTLHIPRSMLQELLRGTRDLPGVTGPLTCSPSGDCVEARMAVYEAVDTDPDHWNPGPGPEDNPHRIWP